MDGFVRSGGLKIFPLLRGAAGLGEGLTGADRKKVRDMVWEARMAVTHGVAGGTRSAWESHERVGDHRHRRRPASKKTKIL